ncbi:MAG: hypothetical protein MJE63_23120 [Proteobacteria bacterium]|nr:hypothetical protein [Pseudomonadota bacterium]
MKAEIYTATGCARCKITKKYMQENAIEYNEFDFKAEGKETFAQFYRAHRNAIFRDKDGVEFPVFHDGKEIRQGVSVILGYLVAGDRLDGFISRSALHGEWIDGFDISGGDPEASSHLYEVLSYLKASNLKVQVITNGKNATVLENLVNNNLCDKIVMEVKGPSGLYEKLTGQKLEENELKQSVKVTTMAPEYSFFTTIAPLEKEPGRIEYLTPEEIGETAKLIEEATGSKKHPYTIRQFDPGQTTNEQLKKIEPLASGALFKYRTAARPFQVMTEIHK